MEDAERALAEAERVLRQNWREGAAEGVPYAYTEPSPGRYPWQWYWDSCFAAIVNRRFEPSRSRAELESLLSAQRPDGFIGHTIFWHRPVSGVRRAFYNVATRTARQTESIQPPLLAWAWSSRSAIRRRSRGSAPRPTGCSPTATSRATDCSGSSSPTSRGSTPRPSSNRSGDGGPTAAPASRCWSTATGGSAGTRGGSSTAAIRSSARPWSTRSGRSRCRRSAGPRRRRRWSSGSGTSERGLFIDEAQPGGLRPAPVTWASLAPLALPDLPEEIGRRLVEEHLLNEREFLTPVAPPSVSVAERTYEPGGGRGPIRRYWRGPAWVNSTWLVWLGMRRLGYGEEADRLAAGMVGAVAKAGLREYYDPRNGRGLGAREFAWSALVAELADPVEPDLPLQRDG